MYRAIVIDDEKWVVKSLLATIKDQPYFNITNEFYDGPSALAFLKTEKIDLAFIDVQLSGSNGLEILREANDLKLPTLFIVISGHAEFAYVQKALFHNAVGYCLKPFSKSELLDSMAKAYDILQQRQPNLTHTLEPEQEKVLETTITDTTAQPLPSYEPSRPKVENKIVQAMLDYIVTHYQEDISMQTISSFICMNPNYASQLFKQETNQTFSSYLTSIRISHAIWLLTNTDMPVILIASHVGYRDYFYFAKVFKKVTGQTPSAFRSQTN